MYIKETKEIFQLNWNDSNTGMTIFISLFSEGPSPSLAFLFFLVILGFELRAFTLARQVRYYLSHSARPIIVLSIFEIGFHNYLPRLALNRNPPDLCLPNK
jgi:hypothetical protein